MSAVTLSEAIAEAEAAGTSDKMHLDMLAAMKQLAEERGTDAPAHYPDILTRALDIATMACAEEMGL